MKSDKKSNPGDYILRARYADTDQMGIVHHARYLEWFESARGHLIRATGYTYKDLEGKGYLMPVLEACVSYIKPVEYDDLVRIRTRVIEASRLKIKLEYELTRDGEEEIRTRGYTLHCFMNPQGKPVRVGKDILDIFQSIM